MIKKEQEAGYYFSKEKSQAYLWVPNVNSWKYSWFYDQGVNKHLGKETVAYSKLDQTQ